MPHTRPGGARGQTNTPPTFSSQPYQQPELPMACPIHPLATSLATTTSHLSPPPCSPCLHSRPQQSSLHRAARQSFFFFLFFFWPHCEACGILVPRPTIEPGPPAVEAWSLNCWTTREVPRGSFSKGRLDHLPLQTLRAGPAPLPAYSPCSSTATTSPTSLT